MNSLAILSVFFCSWFVFAVESRHSDPYCDLIETDEGGRIISECLEEHMPPFIIRLISRCYEVGFNEPGTMVSYLSKFCQRDQHQQQIADTLQCLREKGPEELKASGINERDFQESARRSEECWRSKMPVVNDESSNELEEDVDE